MTDLVARERLQLGRNGNRATSRFTLDALTEGVLIRIARSTPSNSIVFPEGSRLQVNMHFRSGTDDFVQGGFCRGGDRTRMSGVSRARVDDVEARMWRGITKGYFGGDTLRRLGEYKSGLDVIVELSLDGDPIDTFWQIETFASVLSGRLEHRSAAYDTSNTAFDSGTWDGVVTVGLTTTGSSLRGCAAGWNIVDGTPQSTASMTWAGSGMTQIADTAQDIIRGAGYYTNAVSAGSQSIVHTLSSATGVEDHGVVAVSVEDAGDVDETDSAAYGSESSWSGTIATPDADGLIVDMIGQCHSTPGLDFEGAANQTQVEDDHDGAILCFGSSYQSGADGGAMTCGTNPEFGGGVGFAVHFPAGAAAATLEQEGFAFGDDDGNEASHTLGTQDSNASVALDTAKTIRLVVDGTGDPSSTAYALRSQKNGSGGYTAILVGQFGPGTVPVIEAGDITHTNDTNTGDASKEITFPAHSTGDLLIMAGFSDAAVTHTLPGAGPNSETINILYEDESPGAGGPTGSVFWWIATDNEASPGTLTITLSANETLSGECIRVPAGEFDPANPIGATSVGFQTSGTAGSDITSVAVNAERNNSRVLAIGGVDADPMDTAFCADADWTERAGGARDDGAQNSFVATRDTETTAGVSIGAVTFTVNTGDTGLVFIIEVCAPLDDPNEIYVSPSANVAAGGEATTARLTAPSGKTTGDFTTGRRWDDENGSDSIDIEADEYTELEWVLTLQSPTQAADFYDLRVYAGSSPLDTYTVTPRLTVVGGTSINAGSASLDIASQAATVRLNTSFAGTSQSLDIASQAATVELSAGIQATSQSLNIASQPATVSAATAIAATGQALSIAEQAAVVSSNRAIAAGSASLSLAEQAATVTAATQLEATSQSLSIAEQAAAVTLGFNILASSQSLTITADSMTFSMTIQAGSASLSLAAQQASLEQITQISATSVSLDLASQAATVVTSAQIAADSQSLTITANAASVSAGNQIGAQSQSLSLTENAAIVRLHVSITAGQDTISLTEFPSAVTLGFSLLAGSQGLDLTAHAATVIAATGLQASSQSLDIQTYGATVSLHREILASSVSKSITANQAAITNSFLLSAGYQALDIVRRNAVMEFSGAQSIVGESASVTSVGVVTLVTDRAYAANVSSNRISATVSK